MIPIRLEKSTLVITDLYDRVRQLFDPSLQPSRFSQKSGIKKEEAHLPAPNGDMSPGRLFYNPGSWNSSLSTSHCAVYSGSWVWCLKRFSPWHFKPLLGLALSFNNCNWSQFNGLLADPSIMAGIHDVCHILIGLWSLQGRDWTL